MQRGDLVAYYHSGEGKEVVGIARVEREAYRDPTAKEGEWFAVDLAPVKKLNRPVPLSEVKTDSELKASLLAKLSRLSVMPFTERQFARVLELGETKL
jgi:predicted RNA-binding protein with PUA-like domain